jgi:hypothetical protein
MTIDAVCAAALSANKCDCGRPPRQLEGRALSRPIFLGHDGACPSPAIMGKGLGVLLRFACFCHVERSATKSRHRLLLIPRQKFLHFGRHDKADSGEGRARLRFERGRPESLGGIVFAHLLLAMDTTGRHSAAIEAAMLCETVEGLKRAIDNSSRRLLESARVEWERRFAARDPSDACVSVRINSTATEMPASALPCVSFLPKPVLLPAGETRPRPA